MGLFVLWASRSKDGAIAVLRTGETEFKPAREFTRHVSKLARFFDKYSV